MLLQLRRALVLPAIAFGVAAAPSPPVQSPRVPATRFAGFVDRYLDDFARRHPSIAAGNGLHAHDDRLEDFSPAAVRAEIRALHADRATLSAFDTTALTPDERVDRTILLGIVDGWLLEQETLANWRRNPMIHAAAFSDGVHNLLTMANAPAPVRMRRLSAKLAEAPRFFATARAVLVAPPALFLDRGVVMFRGAAAMLANDLPAAFAADWHTPLADTVRQRAAIAAREALAFADHLDRVVRPKATGDFVIGAEALSRRFAAEELIDVPLETLTALGERELVVTQARFREAAARLDATRPATEVWQMVRRDHPARGEVVAAAQRIVDSLTAFVVSTGMAEVPPRERVVVAPAPAFDLGFASMHASPPLEPTPVQSTYYITDADATATPAEQAAWLERFNFASLANTSAHEAMPGHWLHATYMRRTPGKVRRIWIGLNPFPQPSSGQDGWAHYAEALMVEQGFGGGNPRFAMAQLSDALTRICRLLAGIRVHTRQWTVDDAQRCFEREAWVSPPAARREAERAAYDPTYGGYFLGKMAILTLRRDLQAAEGARFSLRRFHERLMTNGIAPIRAHRALLLPGDPRPALHE